MKKNFPQPTHLNYTASNNLRSLELNFIFALTLVIILIQPIKLSSQSMNPPGAEWKKVLWRDKDLMNQSGLPQHLSEEEWWYSHKNLVDVNNGNKQIGYVAVGYQSDLVYPNAGKEADMQYVFNEGSDSPFNPIPSNLDLNNGPLYAPACTEFTFSPNSKTNLRGMVSRLDMNGDMVWCRLPVIHQDGIT